MHKMVFALQEVNFFVQQNFYCILISYISDFFQTFATVFCFLLGNGLFILCIVYKSLITISLALSMADESKEARYICVVMMELCPNASAMILTGTFLLFAMVAQA